MQCPLADGELSNQSLKNKLGLTVSFARCPGCHGIWTAAFDANYLDISAVDEEEAGSSNTTIAPKCPVCITNLVTADGDNIPPGVVAWQCGMGHGYFFPRGQLFKFKKAQEAKIMYFKLWQIPMSSLASVLLASFVLLILSAGIFITYRAVQTGEPLEIRAAKTLVRQNAI